MNPNVFTLELILAFSQIHRHLVIRKFDVTSCGFLELELELELEPEPEPELELELELELNISDSYAN